MSRIILCKPPYGWTKDGSMQTFVRGSCWQTLEGADFFPKERQYKMEDLLCHNHWVEELSNGPQIWWKERL